MMYLQNAKAVSKFLGCAPLFEVGANATYGQIRTNCEARPRTRTRRVGSIERCRPIFRSTLIDDYYRHTKKKKKRLSILQIAVNGVILFLLDEVGVPILLRPGCEETKIMTRIVLSLVMLTVQDP